MLYEVITVLHAHRNAEERRARAPLGVLREEPPQLGVDLGAVGLAGLEDPKRLLLLGDALEESVVNPPELRLGGGGEAGESYNFV